MTGPGAVDTVVRMNIANGLCGVFLWRAAAVLGLVLCTAGCAGLFRTAGLPRVTALDCVLQELALAREDLRGAFPVQAQSFLRPDVAHLLECPLQMPGWAAHLSETIAAGGNSLEGAVAIGSALCGRAVREGDRSAPPGEAPALGHPGLQALYQCLVHAGEVFEQACAGLSREELDQTVAGMYRLLLTGACEAGLTRVQHQRQVETIVQRATRLDIAVIGGAAQLLAREVARVLPGLPSADLMPRRLETPLGVVLIGTGGPDTYAGPMPVLLVDPGGDDTYQFSDHAPLHVIVDCGGNDRYESGPRAWPGAGVLGLGVLVDCAGDDRYRAHSFGPGSGFFGAGLLVDCAGDDCYAAERFGQGAAVCGLGIAVDLGGSDDYVCGIYGQGLGGTGGVGLLIDRGGNDRYRAGTTVPDAREPQQAFQTYAQGFGMGQRLYAAGGIGVLFDGGGDDSYAGSYFCQGASTWYAAGVLIDRTGDDRYHARRYAQGAGVHSSIGVLRDEDGSDAYRSWGVSQGCGHDFAVGLLHDRRGRDTYAAEWLSRGAGNSAGLGILLDGGGDDRFVPEQAVPACGAGVYDLRRDLFSTGICIDRGSATRAGEVMLSGDLGACLRLPEGSRLWPALFQPAPAGQAHRQTAGRALALPPDGVTVPELEGDLFTDAARARAAEALADRGPAVIDDLIACLGLKDVTVQRTIEDALKAIGRSDPGALHARLAARADSPAVQRFLLYVLGDIACPESCEVMIGFLGSPRPELQAMALRGLARLGAGVPPDMTESLARSPAGAVRRFTCQALAGTREPRAIDTLAQLLSDSDFQVRYAALRALQHTPGAATAVKRLGTLQGPARTLAARIHGEDMQPPGSGGLGSVDGEENR